MIISTPKDLLPHNYGNNVFVSQPYLKIVFENGLGFYILNSYRFRWVPKFYGLFHRMHWELGFSLAGWTFEVMWNKHFKF